MPQPLLISLSIVLASWLAGEFIFWILNRRVTEKLSFDVRIRSFVLLSKEEMLATARLAQFCLAWIGRGLIALIVLQILGLAHPDTEAVARAAQGWLTERAVATGRMIVAYLPNLFTIVATLWAARAFLALNRRFFGSIENGGLQLPGFDQRWAVPTRQIIAALTWITAASTVLPLLPGAASPVFRGASVLAGVLISLGSGPAMTNIVSGFLLTYSNAFHVGDVIEVQSYIGRVRERNLLITRLRTFKNQDITLPNSSVMSGNIVNYSNAAREGRLMATCVVTLGYEIDATVVEQILLEAARAGEGWSLSPTPFVLHHALEGSWVAYELNVYLSELDDWLVLQSALRKHVLKAFHLAGVELMTPTLHGLRDAQLPTIPADLCPRPLAATTFKVELKSTQTATA